MEEPEKLSALKRAYADIILNTAKEAAARIMVSERKAMRYQRELASTKEEALRMILRLKQMLDSKVNEAETTSFSQKKKIEELEAQLQEAEEIVKDLREELREVQAELERVTNNPMHPPVEQNVEDEVASQEKIVMDNKIYPCGSICSVPYLRFESIATDKTRNSDVNGSNESSKCCVPHDHINNCYIHNPDFASIVIRRKVPELYRNGCTQRIRAFERSLLDGNISLSGNVDDVQNGTLTRGDEEGKEGEGMCLTTNAKTDVIHEAKKLDEPEVVNADADLIQLPLCNKKSRTKYLGNQNGAAKGDVLVAVPACRKRKRIKRRKHLRSKLHSKPDTVKETNKASNVSCTENSIFVSDNNDPSEENSSKVCENEAQKDLRSPSAAELPNETTVMTEQSRSENDAKKEKVLFKACSSGNKINDDKEMLLKSDLMGQESLSSGRLEVLASRADVEAAHESLDRLDVKVSDLDEKVACQPVNDRLLKYTFQRKRKKDSLSNPDVDCTVEKISLKKKCGEKQNGHAEPQKSCTITESSRDNRRLAQVARQLISLSEKKW